MSKTIADYAREIESCANGTPGNFTLPTHQFRADYELDGSDLRKVIPAMKAALEEKLKTFYAPPPASKRLAQFSLCDEKFRYEMHYAPITGSLWFILDACGIPAGPEEPEPTWENDDD